MAPGRTLARLQLAAVFDATLQGLLSHSACRVLLMGTIGHPSYLQTGLQGLELHEWSRWSHGPGHRCKELETPLGHRNPGPRSSRKQLPFSWLQGKGAASQGPLPTSKRSSKMLAKSTPSSMTTVRVKKDIPSTAASLHSGAPRKA